MKKYNPQKIEKKIQEKWAKIPCQSASDRRDSVTSAKPKYYILDMFPYPSGDGLHMGHTESYTASDIIYRYKKLQGFDVLHPQGFDSFGLPAENYAIKTGVHPKETTKKNVDNYIKQMKMLGLGHDLNHLVYTSDPSYYKWTQWLFGKFFENGLVERKTDKINWCPSCQTGIANEQVEGGKCERCKTEIKQKEVPGWFFKITDFADDLIKDLDKVDWPEATKKNQRNWIGKSVGSKIKFKIRSKEGNKVSSENCENGDQHFSQNDAEQTQNDAEGNSDNFLYKELTYKIRGAIFNVKKNVGLGHKESVYHKALEIEFKKQNINFESEKRINIQYEGKKIGTYQPDFVIEDKIIIELKALPQIGKQQLNQTWTYLKGSQYKLALLVNFSPAELQIKRMVYDTARNLPHSSASVLRESATSLEVFTTRPDTLFGVTYMVIAPEHELIEKILSSCHSGKQNLSASEASGKKFAYPESINKGKEIPDSDTSSADRRIRSTSFRDDICVENIDEVTEYVKKAKNKTEMERMEAKTKTGVKLEGLVAINPANGEEVPIFVADYVLGGYGTGAIMAVPAHDERDYAFAKKYNLPIKPVILKQEEVSRSFVMGINKDTKKEFKKIGIKIVEEDKEGNLKVFISTEKINNYKEIIKQQMQPHYWNEFSTEKGFCFVFKHKNGCIEELELNEKTNNKIDEYGMTFNDEKPKKNFENVYSWLAKNSFYEEILIHSNNGILINSGKFDGMDSEEAKRKITEFVGGEMTTNYRLRDWSISRQRYWGCPIPIVYSPEGEAKFVGEENLPWLLPEDVDFVPTGIAPLAKSKELKERTEKLFGKGWTPDVDTMDTFVDSSWYFLRYPDTENEKEFCSPEKLKRWLPVDLYIGGAEHTYMHLLYARFFYKAMKKMGLFEFPVQGGSALGGDEPFLKLRHQGMVLDKNGVKMSKSKGNVINPNDMVKKFGADATRMYMMFAGPLEEDIMFKEEGVKGVYRFLEKTYNFFQNFKFKILNFNSISNDEISKDQISSVILMHGKNTDPSQKWYLWLIKEMEKRNIKVLAPKLPKANDPVIDEWIEEIEKTNPDKNSILIGHSRGGVAILRWLERQPDNFKVKKIILVATNSGDSEKRNKTENDKGFFTKSGYNFEKIKKHCDNFVVLHSRDDEWVPFSSGEENAQGLDAKFLTFDNRGHFGSKLKKQEVPELLDEILNDLNNSDDNDEVMKLLHKTIKGVTEDIEELKFNTAISKLMIFINTASQSRTNADNASRSQTDAEKTRTDAEGARTNAEGNNEKRIILPKSAMEKFLIMLSPFAPHLAENLWGDLGHKTSIFDQEWPKYNPEMIKEEEVELVVQVNGKVRDKMEVPADISEEDAKEKVLESKKIKKWIKCKKIKKVIFVKGKLINIVV